jgi:hypothetical protein
MKLALTLSRIINGIRAGGMRVSAFEHRRTADESRAAEVVD